MLNKTTTTTRQNYKLGTSNKIRENPKSETTIKNIEYEISNAITLGPSLHISIMCHFTDDFFAMNFREGVFFNPGDLRFVFAV